MIPRHYMVANARNRLKSYIELYLKEEIIEEAVVQNVDDFVRFLKVQPFRTVRCSIMRMWQRIVAFQPIRSNLITRYFVTPC